MAPSASAYHSNSINELAATITIYVRQHKCGKVFTDSLDLHLPDGNIFRPDLIVITKENAGLVNWNRGIYGVPDMVVEVLSKSTRKRDLTVKKDVYEKNGVGVYWIIDPFIKSVTVFNLRDGKFELDDEYIYYNEEDFAELTEEEKATAKFEISPSIFPELKIKLSFIFGWVY